MFIYCVLLFVLLHMCALNKNTSLTCIVTPLLSFEPNNIAVHGGACMISCKHNCAVELVPSVHPTSTNICLADTDVSAHARALLKRAASPGGRDPPSNRPWTSLMPHCQPSRQRASYYRTLTAKRRRNPSGTAHRLPLHHLHIFVAGVALHQSSRTWSRSARLGASECDSTQRTSQLVISDTQWL